MVQQEQGHGFGMGKDISLPALILILTYRNSVHIFNSSLQVCSLATQQSSDTLQLQFYMNISSHSCVLSCPLSRSTLSYSYLDYVLE
jgi:hypothetical protein